MPAFTASRKIDRVRINESLCEMVTNLVTSWCPDSARLRLTIAGQDDSGLSKSADLACLPDAISYISSLGLVSQLRVVCQAEERNATVRLYDDHQKVNDNSIEVESNADEENERFIAAFTASIKEQVVQQAQTNADAQPVSQVGRTILLRYIRLDANTIISLAELCGQLLGSDDLHDRHPGRAPHGAGQRSGPVARRRARRGPRQPLAGCHRLYRATRLCQGAGRRTGRRARGRRGGAGVAARALVRLRAPLRASAGDGLGGRGGHRVRLWAVRPRAGRGAGQRPGGRPRRRAQCPSSFR